MSRRGRPELTLATLTFAACLSLYIATAGGSLSTTDAVVAYDLTRSLVQRRSVALSGNLLGLESNRGADGRYYSQFGIGQSVYNVPFYVAGRLLGRSSGLRVGDAETIPKAAVALGSAVAASACVAVVLLFAWQMTGSAAAGVSAAAVCGLASLWWPYAKFGFNAPLAGLLLTAAAWTLWRGVQAGSSRLVLCTGVLVGAAWLTRHETPVVAAPLAIWCALESRRRGIALPTFWRFAAGVLCGGVTWAAYNYVRFGDPWRVGYAPEFSFEGYWGLLLSPGGSVFLYSPTILLGVAGLATLPRGRRADAILLAGPFIASVLFFGALSDWPGGRSYGPRYLVPALPLLSVAAARLWPLGVARPRLALVAIVTAGALWQLPGVLVDYSKVSLEWARAAPPASVRERHAHWASSALTLNTVAAWRAVPANARYVTGIERPPAPSGAAARDSEAGFGQRFAFSLDFWWLYLHYMNVLPAIVAVACGGLLLASSALLWWRTCRAAASLDRASTARAVP